VCGHPARRFLDFAVGEAQHQREREDRFQRRALFDQISSVRTASWLAKGASCLRVMRAWACVPCGLRA